MMLIFDYQARTLMKKSIVAIAFGCALATAGIAQAQAQNSGAYAIPVPQTGTNSNPFPNLPLQSDTSPYPGLRERSFSDGTRQAPAQVQDTPESRQIYSQCQRRADREATSNAVMRRAVAQCLNELNQRRQQGQ
jgi:hypothetical protein